MPFPLSIAALQSLDLALLSISLIIVYCISIILTSTQTFHYHYCRSILKSKWHLFPTSTRSALKMALARTVSKMKEQEASNCLSGLGRLGCTWDSLDESLQVSLEVMEGITLQSGALDSSGFFYHNL